jgi:hypothetical protein
MQGFPFVEFCTSSTSQEKTDSDRYQVEEEQATATNGIEFTNRHVSSYKNKNQNVR